MFSIVVCFGRVSYLSLSKKVEPMPWEQQLVAVS